MSCNIRIAGPLRPYSQGASSVRAAGSDLGMVLSDLEGMCPGIRRNLIDDQNRIRDHIRVFVNACETDDLGAPVAAGDVVELVCALSGG